MPDMLFIVIAAIIGLALGFVGARAVLANSAKRDEQEAKNILDTARSQAETLKKEAEAEITDETVKNYTNGEYTTVDAYKQKLKDLRKS